jgi:type IV secretion system protein TrbL
MRREWLKPAWVGLCLVTMFVTGTAYAQMAPGPTVSRIIEVFRDNASQWEGSLRQAALGLFWGLAGIEFSWTAIKLALKNADLSEFLAELVNRILYIGFFLTLLLHSSEWATAIVQSFRMAADAAGAGHGISPANILEIAVNIGTKLLADTNVFLNPADAMISCLCAISIVLCFGLMAGNMIEALVESYIVISAGVIMMGFGGSSWTSEYAKKILVYAVSVGAKLFLIQLIMGLAERIASQLANEFNGANLEDALVMVGVSLILWIVSLNVPNKVQGLINGTSVGQGGMIAGAVASGVAAGTAAAATVLGGGSNLAMGAVSAARGSYALATEQLKESSSQPPSLGQKLKRAGDNLGQAAMENLGQRFRGEVRHGNAGMQMGHSMRQSAEMLKESRSGGTKPEAPSKPYTSPNSIQPDEDTN